MVATSRQTTFNIPIIRLHDADKAKTVQGIRDACINVGFFFLEDHGIDSHLLNAALRECKRLFDLPLESKVALSDHVLSRGYTAMEEERLDPAIQKTRGDTKEGFYIGQHVPETDPRYDPAKLSGPNQWPNPNTTPEMREPQLFQSTMMNYIEKLQQVGLQVVRLIALALEMKEDFFDEAFLHDPMIALRLLHYAPVASCPKEGIFACGAHSDYGMLTLLLTDENPGLQILTKANEWKDVPYRKDAFVVNLGDMLERWTNGLFRSTKHRVVMMNAVDRYSIPFFYEPNFDTLVKCLDVCCSAENPAKYEPITSGQYLLGKYKQTHADFSP